MPDVPDEYQDYLLATPITASVTVAGASSTTPGVIRGQASVVTLDVGKTSAILPGMEFYVIDPDGLVAYRSELGPFGFDAGAFEKAIQQQIG